MRKRSAVTWVACLVGILAAAGCGGTTSDTERASSALCEKLPAQVVVDLFDVGPNNGASPTDAQVSTEPDSTTSAGGPGCKWLTSGSALGVTAYTVEGGATRLATVSADPVDVGDGVTLFPPKNPDETQCQADFTATGAPADQALVVVVLPDLSLSRAPNPSVDWCTRSVPAVKTVIRGLGWIP